MGVDGEMVREIPITPFIIMHNLVNLLTNYGFWSADIPDEWVRKRDEVVSIPYLTRISQAPVIKDKKELTGKHLGFFTEFPTKEGETG